MLCTTDTHQPIKRNAAPEGEGRRATHGDLFRVALPRVHDYYSHLARVVKGDAGPGVVAHVYHGESNLPEHER